MTTDAIVFVVDDDESVRKALARLIGSVGLEVQTFPSPAAFLAHPRPDRPACLVLDLRMPGTSGLPNKLVGDRLGASEKTIKVHRARVMQKMHADSLAHLVRMAQVVGIGASGTGATS